jgi:hypothetical protein
MAQLYYDLIKAGKWSIGQVPLRWRDAVQTKLDADNQQGE